MTPWNGVHAATMPWLLLFLAASSAAAQTSRFTESDVVFQNGGVELHGTLMLPAAGGPHPAVVFLHGSGPSTRAGARGYAEEFARIGVASLFFDKRGSGSSGGSWITSSLDDLAGDALAAIGFLKARSEVDTARIGLWGVSQAGWVATVAASRSRDVGFLILVSGGGATPLESERFSYNRAFDQGGFTAEEKAEASAILDMYFRYLATGEARSELVARIAKARAGSLSPLAEQLDRILPSEENRVNWSWVATWDPLPAIARISCPLLLMFGDRDNDHPTTVAVQKWRTGLAQAGNARATIMIFPGAAHGIRMSDVHRGTGRAPFADGYIDAMLGWLWRNVVDPRE
ncbi:MAG TPA: prolyl oligopeptidase family serine peptidase [Gemmatimonadaceae bacterium]